MMLYLVRKKVEIEAKAEYSLETNETVVLKESMVSKEVSHSNKFRGAKTVAKLRESNVDDNHVVTKDITFRSPSTAANFVTGNSTNGLLAWKDENGRTLKEILNDKVDK